jgi:hypothetical protein
LIWCAWFRSGPNKLHRRCPTIPILSADALEKFISADWNADTDDNLLTEWIIMYFCYKHKDKIPQSRLKCIFPILIGSRTNSNANGAVTFADFFAEGWKDKLPNEVSTGTIAIVKELLVENKISPLPQELDDCTVKSIVSGIMECLGLKYWTIPNPLENGPRS